jgi:hypothetical protein
VDGRDQLVRGVLDRRIFPLVSYLLGSASLVLALAIGAVGLFAAGAITSRFTTRSWWLSGLRQLSAWGSWPAYLAAVEIRCDVRVA